MSNMPGGLAILDIHTPSSSFAIPHSLREDTLQTLFDRLTRKMSGGGLVNKVGPGWVKYEWNTSTWDLDDEADYSIFTWRMNPSGSSGNPTIFVHNPNARLPAAPAYQNPSYYAFRPAPVLTSPPLSADEDSVSRRIAPSIRSVRSKRSTKSKAGSDMMDDYKTRFHKFHNENGVRTVNGKIGPVEGVRMLLKSGHRHVYLSRSFAQLHGFIPTDTAPGHYGYSGLVQIGKWPITVGSVTSTLDVYLSEEMHFDVILGRSFMEKRGIKLDPLDPTFVVCMDNGEKIDCDIVVIKDWRGEVVTIT